VLFLGLDLADYVGAGKVLFSLRLFDGFIKLLCGYVIGDCIGVGSLASAREKV